MVEWYNANPALQHLTLFDHIRYGCISPGDLVHYVQPSASFVKDHLFNALLYHSAPREMKTNFSSVKTQPREGVVSSNPLPSSWKWVCVPGTGSLITATLSDDGLKATTPGNYSAIRSSEQLLPGHCHKFQLKYESWNTCCFLGVARTLDPRLGSCKFCGCEAMGERYGMCHDACGKISTRSFENGVGLPWKFQGTLKVEVDLSSEPYHLRLQPEGRDQVSITLPSSPYWVICHLWGSCQILQ